MTLENQSLEESGVHDRKVHSDSHSPFINTRDRQVKKRESERERKREREREGVREREREREDKQDKEE